LKHATVLATPFPLGQLRALKPNLREVPLTDFSQLGFDRWRASVYFLLDEGDPPLGNCDFTVGERPEKRRATTNWVGWFAQCFENAKYKTNVISYSSDPITHC
jgi:hypothetical protein